MALTAIASSVFNATRSSDEELAAVVETSTLAASAASSGANISYSFSPVSWQGGLTFDLRALNDDRGTLTFTAVYGIILKVRTGTMTTVNAFSLPAGALTCQPAGSGSSILIPAGGVYAVASATPIATVSASSYSLDFVANGLAKFDLYIWGEGTIA
jgi:hypothetical protein